MLTGEFLEVAN